MNDDTPPAPTPAGGRFPSRVVSLTCSNTEIVAALGAADRLVGIDDYSDFPADVVADLPRVGPDLGIDIDAVRALRPDLVLASLTVPGHEAVVEAIDRAGLEWIAPAPESLEDVYRDVRTIAERLGLEEAGTRVVSSMQARIGDPPAEPATDAPRVLVEWWPKPVIAPGRRSWVTDMLACAGAVNPLAGDDVKSRPVTPEEIDRVAPDAIVIAWCGVDPSKYRPDVVLGRDGWQSLAAIREQRVFCVPEGLLGRPGPRVADGVAALRAVVDSVGGR